MKQPWITRLNTRREMGPIWKEQAVVETSEHMKLFYGESVEPVALVSYSRQDGFYVQFLMGRFPVNERPVIRNAVHAELRRFLPHNMGSDPWGAVRDHSPVMADRSSKFRWDWHS